MYLSFFYLLIWRMSLGSCTQHVGFSLRQSLQLHGFTDSCPHALQTSHRRASRSLRLDLTLTLLSLLPWKASRRRHKTDKTQLTQLVSQHITHSLCLFQCCSDSDLWRNLSISLISRLKNVPFWITTSKLGWFNVNISSESSAPVLSVCSLWLYC